MQVKLAVIVLIIIIPYCKKQLTMDQYLLTYSMEQSPTWEANRFAASQEIPRILWNPNVHYRIHKFSPRVPILSQLDPVHTSTYHFLEIHFNIILPSTPGSPQCSLSPRFPHQNPVHTSPLSPMRATCPAHPILLDFITHTILGEEYRTLGSSLCSFLYYPIISFRLGKTILSKWGIELLNVETCSTNDHRRLATIWKMWLCKVT